MSIIEKNNKLEYTYKLKNGISHIKGGTKILNDLEYPEIIINSVNNIIKDLKI